MSGHIRFVDPALAPVALLLFCPEVYLTQTRNTQSGRSANWDPVQRANWENAVRPQGGKGMNNSQKQKKFGCARPPAVPAVPAVVEQSIQNLKHLL